MSEFCSMKFMFSASCFSVSTKFFRICWHNKIGWEGQVAYLTCCEGMRKLVAIGRILYDVTTEQACTHTSSRIVAYVIRTRIN